MCEAQFVVQHRVGSPDQRHHRSRDCYRATRLTTFVLVRPAMTCDMLATPLSPNPNSMHTRAGVRDRDRADLSLVPGQHSLAATPAGGRPMGGTSQSGRLGLGHGRVRRGPRALGQSHFPSGKIAQPTPPRQVTSERNEAEDPAEATGRAALMYPGHISQLDFPNR